MALNQPQMKNGPALLSPTPSNAGSWFSRRDAATECEVDLALMAKSEAGSDLDAGQEAIWSAEVYFAPRMQRALSAPWARETSVWRKSTPSHRHSGLTAPSTAYARMDAGSLTVIVVPAGPVALATVAPSWWTKAST